MTDETPKAEESEGGAVAAEAGTDEKKPAKLHQAVESTDVGPCKKHIKVTVQRAQGSDPCVRQHCGRQAARYNAGECHLCGPMAVRDNPQCADTGAGAGGVKVGGFLGPEHRRSHQAGP